MLHVVLLLLLASGAVPPPLSISNAVIAPDAIARDGSRTVLTLRVQVHQRVAHYCVRTPCPQPEPTPARVNLAAEVPRHASAGTVTHRSFGARTETVDLPLALDLADRAPTDSLRVLTGTVHLLGLEGQQLDCMRFEIAVNGPNRQRPRPRADVACPDSTPD
ncbi:hypothetical protein [Rubricoccus marinus]|uniref:Uncharacterized protein n=1 Tax=Rubricoccus marinus TaxID=716817 RepID=A0A259TXQ4_9BACT|nr:hypothetical protein [Rubricoccus marinus]OZC02358.1 hypothetical protein BSZ36_04825 [Rubricoccus marinus]